MITLIMGSMYSGKTTEMLRVLERGRWAGKKIVLLRPKKDTRPFLSHSVKDISWLKELFVDLKAFEANEYDIVGIDEAQFAHGLKDFCLKYSSKKCKIVLSALHATSECEMFDPIIEIIPYCEEIIKLNAVCTGCGSEQGNYTFFKGGAKSEKVVVGGTDKYTALCAECYNQERM
jgi:thymidine kinase